MPLGNGFDHSYLLEDQDRHFAPKKHFLDDRPLPGVEPDSGFYSTVAIADHCVESLKQHAVEHPVEPFFQYLAFTCPHFPLQALPDDIAKYHDRFAEGWDALRAGRLERMQTMGLVHCTLSARTPGVPAWSSLNDTERADWQRRMAIHAAMVDRMDQEIGRVLAQLRAMQALDNTLILFLSDNGASAERILRGDGHDPHAPAGSAKSYLCLEPPWANLANAPLRRSKIFVHEGGIATPLIVHWPLGIAARGELRHNPGHVIDLVPTLLEVVGGEKPSTLAGVPVPPAPGRSLATAFARDGSVSHDDLWWFHTGNRAIRIGDWKLVSQGDSPWELYDLNHDRSETHDLAHEQPERVHQMEQAWTERLEEARSLAASDK
jgi:arylsulfatase A-like enzyme